MDILHNTRPAALTGLDDVPFPSVDADAPIALLKRCPAAGQTPLVAAKPIAAQADVAEVWIKDERGRMGLGSFKALGAAYVIAHDAEQGNARGATYVTASAGNHGMSVAAGAAAFGARAVVYIAQTVPEAFAARLADQGAEVVRAGETYEASMKAAAQAASDNGCRLLSDSSWEGYMEYPHRVMEGYLALMAEAIEQMEQVPTHIFLQAGVGGLAGSCATLARQVWGDVPRIIVVEPAFAAALYGSVAAGGPTEGGGPVSNMGRLDCKMPSLIALKGLARDADDFVLLSEAEAEAGAGAMMVAGWPSTESGAAGVAALLAASAQQRRELDLTKDARVLCILSEGAEG
ncbi:pyridoxal-phosphate dependent enzyme [Sulfitobacter mediterraneus]|uniref:pyridoxal-phosphate dependent enzyme n=1 Tax=Sulfitobacter mediterraneus TaxID=83219 RepID=UPI00193A714C|nr:pyridoxal-phosphate dependent enzyme [Sulfitobacter mediterraneus]MBM1555534.1 pyridoxal-phosphate dependent enzyme [Sulfitobacter mediterraneus]MBM1566913.1 pyridoxal-phosphate dependent enzyme [Sulfitobacter mediterraneus]MBM1570715.1 pyridoxal-phosphate dependent enzyme [Sulfitobacter mediterraneus]MBM1574515.1 pyridoxal-phosphate dependent enzyme [Sulfitobacter mediterraneus]MBM1578492.1 pyridoxal-phosphate dependent enzyme [Sulfitobacter mediterraneus]